MIKASQEIGQLPMDLSKWEEKYYGWRYDLGNYSADVSQRRDGRFDITLFDAVDKIIRGGSGTGYTKPENGIHNANIWLAAKAKRMDQDQ